jgi:hypothetical protein
MRTYEDSFSFQRIYPGKVRYPIHFPSSYDSRPSESQYATPTEPSAERESDNQFSMTPTRVPDLGDFARAMDNTVNFVLTYLCYRVSSSSAATARSFGSRTANPNRFSCSGRTPVVLPGPSCSVDNTERESPRYEQNAQFNYPSSDQVPPFRSVALRYVNAIGGRGA